MVKVLAINDIKIIIQRVGLQNFFIELINRLRQDFSCWPEFHKTPRHATHYPHGVIELMPISNDQYYSFKYVNGHPRNPESHKLNVIAIGLLAEVAHGYPLLLTEMSVLTALRTAATSALASTYLAPAHPRSMAMIGGGSQAEFQILAHHFALGIKQINYYDKDPLAMTKLARNLAKYPLLLKPAADIPTAIADVDIITTATAAKIKALILHDQWIKSGVHINAIGGDCPGKTELDPNILLRSKIVVENFAQTCQEGEIQHLEKPDIYAELWEIITGRKPGRQTSDEIFVFDSVGFALEDFTILKYIYDLANEFNLGTDAHLLPHLDNPKDLFSLLL